MAVTHAAPRPPEEFRHEALMYSGMNEYVEATSRFIREGVEAGEAALVVVSAVKIEMLRDALGKDAASVQFADMAGVGINPARIIPAWREFVSGVAGTGRRFRGIGEPIWPERTEDELAECQKHEALLNVAFDGGTAWWLLCPYDVDRLSPDVLDEARRSHPFVWHGSDQRVSEAYLADLDLHPFSVPLREPALAPAEVGFDLSSLPELRRQVARHAARAGLGVARVADLAMAVNEVATNSIRFGGGCGVARLWPDAEAVVCEIRDDGQISEPLVGRERPGEDIDAARGLWLAHQLCDLVQIRSVQGGQVVRLRVKRV